MFIGHVAGGYILTTFVLKKTDLSDHLKNTLFWMGIVASILPDFDIFYFYLIDHRQNSHHSYWTHLPIYWLAITAFLLITSTVFKKKVWTIATIILSTNVFLHLILDTFTGHIQWFYPFYNHRFVLFHVPAIYGWWIWNFLFHWTFLFEILLLIMAYMIYRKNIKMVTFFKKNKGFIIILIISFLAFEGIEHLLHELFDIDLEHLLAFGGVGTVVLFGFKFHIFCCAIPATFAAFMCARKKHDHCDHKDHEH